VSITLYNAGIIHYGNIYPNRLILYSGENIHLECYSVGRPTWLYFNMLVQSKYINNNGFSITIKNATNKNTGRYFCQGLLPSMQTFSTISSVYV